MKYHAGDRLTINYGGKVRSVKVANRLDHMQTREDRLKVVFDGDFKPVTINTDCIIGFELGVCKSCKRNLVPKNRNYCRECLKC